jgi:hypothetical protein
MDDEVAWAAASGPGTLAAQGVCSSAKAMAAVQNHLSQGHVVIVGPKEYVEGMVGEVGGGQPEDDEPMELTRESIEAADEAELDELLEAHGLEADDFEDVDAKREAVLKAVFVDA